MIEASRAQELLLAQSVKIDRLENVVKRLELKLVGLSVRNTQLEAALLWYAEHCQKGGDDIEGPYGDYGQRARKALEGKDD